MIFLVNSAADTWKLRLMMGMFNETSGLNGGFEVSMWFSLQRFDSLTSESDIFASFIPVKEKENRVEIAARKAEKYKEKRVEISIKNRKKKWDTAKKYSKVKRAEKYWEKKDLNNVCAL